MRKAKRSFDSLSPFTLNCDTPWMNSRLQDKKEKLGTESNFFKTRITFKIYFSIAILVKYVDDPLHKRILLQLR